MIKFFIYSYQNGTYDILDLVDDMMNVILDMLEPVDWIHLKRTCRCTSRCIKDVNDKIMVPDLYRHIAFIMHDLIQNNLISWKNTKDRFHYKGLTINNKSSDIWYSKIPMRFHQDARVFRVVRGGTAYPVVSWDNVIYLESHNWYCKNPISITFTFDTEVTMQVVIIKRCRNPDSILTVVDKISYIETLQEDL